MAPIVHQGGVPSGRSMLPDSCTILPTAAVTGPGVIHLGVDELARLKKSITRHAGEGLTRTALPGVSVVCSQTTTEPLGSMAEPTLSVIAQGVKETALNGRTFTYGPGQFLVVSVELPVIGHVTRATVEEPFLAFVLELRPDRIAALLLETAPAATAGPALRIPRPPGSPSATRHPRCSTPTGRLLALLDAPEDAAALAAGVEREVLWRLLHRPAGSDRAPDRASRQPARAPSPRHPLDPRPLQRDAARRGARGARDDERLLVPPPLPRGHLDDADPVPEADPPARGRARLLAEPGDSPASASRSATTAPRSSAASTGACSACLPAATRSRCARPPHARLFRRANAYERAVGQSPGRRAESAAHAALSHSPGPTIEPPPGEGEQLFKSPL